MVSRNLFFISVMLLFSSSSMALTSLQASVDSNPVVQGEYFALTIIADDEIDAANLDTSILLKDFIVGRTSVSRSTKMLNFKTSKETRWQILLAAKQQGQINIPPLAIGQVSSRTIPLKVVAAGSTPAKMKTVFMQSHLSHDEAYVGQMLIYTVKLYLAAELQRGALNAPVLEGAEIKQIGDDNDYQDIVDGRRFRVIERTYAVTPNFPGELTIDGASFTGDILIDASGRGGLFTFNESRPMHAKAQKQVVLVNSLPKHLNGSEFVADLVVLKQSWPQNADGEAVEYQVGSPITREITLIASNADENNLPIIEQNLPQSFKVYPEKPQRKSIVREKQLVSQVIQTAAIVPTAAGTFTLPEIKVPWWNPQLKRLEVASIPAKTITVTAPAMAAPPSMPVANNRNDTDLIYWQSLSALLTIAWLATLGVWYRSRTQKLTQTIIKTNAAAKPQGEKALFNGVKRACEANNSGQVLHATLCYFRHIWDEDLTLLKLSQAAPELGAAIEQLQAIAYGNHKQDFDYNEFISLVKKISQQKSAGSQTKLQPLNP